MGQQHQSSGGPSAGGGPPSSRSQQHHSSNTMPNPPSRPSLMGSRYNGGGGPSEYNTTSNSYNSSRDRYRDYRTSSAMSSMNKDFDKGEPPRNRYMTSASSNNPSLSGSNRDIQPPPFKPSILSKNMDDSSSYNRQYYPPSRRPTILGYKDRDRGAGNTGGGPLGRDRDRDMRIRDRDRDRDRVMHSSASRFRFGSSYQPGPPPKGYASDRVGGNSYRTSNWEQQHQHQQQQQHHHQPQSVSYGKDFDNAELSHQSTSSSGRGYKRRASDELVHAGGSGGGGMTSTGPYSAKKPKVYNSYMPSDRRLDYRGRERMSASAGSGRHRRIEEEHEDEDDEEDDEEDEDEEEDEEDYDEDEDEDDDEEDDEEDEEDEDEDGGYDPEEIIQRMDVLDTEIAEMEKLLEEKQKDQIRRRSMKYPSGIDGVPDIMSPADDAEGEDGESSDLNEVVKEYPKFEDIRWNVQKEDLPERLPFEESLPDLESFLSSPISSAPAEASIVKPVIKVTSPSHQQSTSTIEVQEGDEGITAPPANNDQVEQPTPTSTTVQEDPETAIIRQILKRNRTKAAQMHDSVYTLLPKGLEFARENEYQPEEVKVEEAQQEEAKVSGDGEVTTAVEDTQAENADGNVDAEKEASKDDAVDGLVKVKVERDEDGNPVTQESSTEAVVATTTTSEGIDQTATTAMDVDTDGTVVVKVKTENAADADKENEDNVNVEPTPKPEVKMMNIDDFASTEIASFPTVRPSLISSLQTNMAKNYQKEYVLRARFNKYAESWQERVEKLDKIRDRQASNGQQHRKRVMIHRGNEDEMERINIMITSLCKPAYLHGMQGYDSYGPGYGSAWGVSASHGSHYGGGGRNEYGNASAGGGGAAAMSGMATIVDVTGLGPTSASQYAGTAAAAAGGNSFNVVMSRNTRRAAQTSLQTDFVRTEAELEEIIARLGAEEVAAERTKVEDTRHAIVPPMIVDESERILRWFKDDNHMVRDPMPQYDLVNEKFMAKWPSEERKLFKAKVRECQKNFQKVAQFFPGRTTQDCVEMYYRDKYKDSMRGWGGRRNGYGYGARRKKARNGPSARQRERSRNTGGSRMANNADREDMDLEALGWTTEEVMKAITLIEQYEDDYETIAQELGSKTVEEVKSFIAERSVHGRNGRRRGGDRRRRNDAKKGSNNQNNDDDAGDNEDGGTKSRSNNSRRKRTSAASRKKAREDGEGDRESVVGDDEGRSVMLETPMPMDIDEAKKLGEDGGNNDEHGQALGGAESAADGAKRRKRTSKKQRDGEQGDEGAATASRRRKNAKEQQANVANANGEPGSPAIARKTVSYWSVGEREAFCEALRKHGMDWERISVDVGSKSSTQVRNFYRNYRDKFDLDRYLREGNHYFEDKGFGQHHPQQQQQQQPPQHGMHIPMGAPHPGSYHPGPGQQHAEAASILSSFAQTTQHQDRPGSINSMLNGPPPSYPPHTTLPSYMPPGSQRPPYPMYNGSSAIEQMPAPPNFGMLNPYVQDMFRRPDQQQHQQQQGSQQQQNGESGHQQQHQQQQPSYGGPPRTTAPSSSSIPSTMYPPPPGIPANMPPQFAAAAMQAAAAAMFGSLGKQGVYPGSQQHPQSQQHHQQQQQQQQPPSTSGGAGSSQSAEAPVTTSSYGSTPVTSLPYYPHPMHAPTTTAPFMTPSFVPTTQSGTYGGPPSMTFQRSNSPPSHQSSSYAHIQPQSSLPHVTHPPPHSQFVSHSHYNPQQPQQQQQQQQQRQHEQAEQQAAASEMVPPPIVKPSLKNLLLNTNEPNGSGVVGNGAPEGQQAQGNGEEDKKE